MNFRNPILSYDHQLAFDIHLLFEIIFKVILVKNSHNTNALTNIIAFDLTKWFSTIHLYRNYFISVAFYSISIHNNQRPYYKFKTFQQITFRFFFARELCSWQYVLHKSRYLQVQNHLNLCSNLCKKFGTNFCIETKRNSPLPFLIRQIFQNIRHIQYNSRDII